MIKKNFNSLIWIVITLLWGYNSKPILSQDNSTLTRGIVKELVNGDLMCYVTLIDENGEENIIGANFEVCEQSEKFLDQKVNLTYDLANINDCESNEPCGKIRQELIIIKMDSIE